MLLMLVYAILGRVGLKLLISPVSGRVVRVLDIVSRVAGSKPM